MTIPVVGTAPPLRVFGWPAFANRAEQPYNWLLSTHLQALGVPVHEFSSSAMLAAAPGDVIHLHWSPLSRVSAPSAAGALARSTGLIGMLRWARRRGAKVVWTVHNLAAHDREPRPWLESRFWPAFTACLDGVVSLSRHGVQAAWDTFPGIRSVPAFVVPHGHYRSLLPAPQSRQTARGRVHIPSDAPVVLFAGQIRPYKGVPDLVRAFQAMPDPDAVLVIAGAMKMGGESDALRAAARTDRRIILAEGFIGEADLMSYLAAADLVVLPYRRILHSGAAVLALSANRPVLLPRLGALPELAEEVGPEWVTTYAGALTAGLLSEALQTARAARRPEVAPLERHEWPRVARATREVYRTVVRGSRLAERVAGPRLCESHGVRDA